MFWLLYNVLLTLGSPVIILLLLTKKRCQRGIFARLGNVPAELQNLPGPVVWVHAASLGEVTAIIPLIKAMKTEDPQQEFVISTVTETGREMVLNRLPGIATHCYAPLDFWWAVTPYVRVINPRLFLLVESEIWPNLLTSLHHHQVPVCLVNGRISSRSYSRYRLVKKFMNRVWASLDMALMQTTQDADRIRELGTNGKVVHVTGNMKFDQSFEYSDKGDWPTTLRKILGISKSEEVIVAGSTHPQEEEYLLQAYQTLCATQKHVVLILAPRHIERVSEVEKVIERYGFPCVRRSQISETKPVTVLESPRVILLDSRGELPYVYSLGIVGFVGGTLVPVGGHNLLEPAQWSRPVMFGPYVDHCRDMAHQLLEAGGALQAHQRDALGGHLMHLLENPQEAERMGRQAFSVIQQNRGVVETNLKMIRQLTKRSGPSAQASQHPGLSAPADFPEVMGNRHESSATMSS